MTKTIKPFLKWTGSKQRLLDTILKFAPDNIENYYEPFLGGGAVALNIDAKNHYVSDINLNLIRCWTQVQVNTESVLDSLKFFRDNRETFLLARHLLNHGRVTGATGAALFIYINKCCFNGLYRVNKKGEFNTSYGDGKKTKFIDTENLKLVVDKIKNWAIDPFCFDEHMTDTDFMYLDPPYYIDKTSKFVGYDKSDFGHCEHVALLEQFEALDQIGMKLMMSNSAASWVYDNYKKYNIREVEIHRTNGGALGRRRVKELIITNY